MCHRAHRHDSSASSVVVMKTHQEAHRKHREVPAEVPSCSQREHGAGQDASQLLSQREPPSGTHPASLPPASLCSTAPRGQQQSSPEPPLPPGLGGAFPAALGPGARPFKELVLQHLGRMEFTPRTPGNCLFTVRGAAEVGDWRVSFSRRVGDTPQSLEPRAEA